MLTETNFSEGQQKLIDRLRHKGILYDLGMFDTISGAAKARKAAELLYRGRK